MRTLAIDCLQNPPPHQCLSEIYSEIIAIDNGSSTLCKHVFFSPTGLDHYCTEYNSVAPQTTTLNLSIISVHSPFHTSLFFESFCPSLVPLFCHSAYHTIVFTHYISQLFVQECCFLLSCFPNPFFLLYTHIQVQVFLKLHLSDMCWVSVPRG